MRPIAATLFGGLAGLAACAKQPAPTTNVSLELAPPRQRASMELITAWDRGNDPMHEVHPGAADLPPAAPGGAGLRSSLFDGELSIATSHVAALALPWVEPCFEEVAAIDLRIKETSARAAARWVAEGQVEAALIAGPLNQGELDLGLVATPVADHVLVVVAHPSVGFTNIDQPYLKQILTGTINHWSWVGSDAGHVALVLPQPGEAAAFIAREFIPGDPLTDKSIRYSDEAEGLLQVRSTPGAIGIFSLASTVGVEGIKTLSVGSREPGEAYLRGGYYPFGSTIHLVTRGQPQGKVADLRHVLLGL